MTTTRPSASNTTTTATISTSGRLDSDVIPPPPRAELEREQAKRGKGQREQPKAGDDLRLRPAAQLEVMVQRGHFEDAPPARKTKIRHLNDDRQRNDDIHPADDDEE